MGRTLNKPAGRPKGSPNKATATREAALAKQGLMPLAYMLEVLRDTSQEDAERKWAAQNAAPYCHPRLQQISADITGTFTLRDWLQKLGEPD